MEVENKWGKLTKWNFSGAGNHSTGMSEKTA